MIEPDIVVDKRGPLELRVLFNHIGCDWILEDRGIEVVDTIEGKVVQTNGNDGGDGSHVQEGFGRQSKTEGLIYPGIDPERIMPNCITESSTRLWAQEKQLWEKRSGCGGKICAAAQQFRGGGGVGTDRIKGQRERGGAVNGFSPD